MVHGQLEVQAINARNLRKNQLLGKMDPYMTLRVETSKIRTRTLKNADREPVWNETFKFQIIDGQNLLYIEVWNDNVGSDSLVGTAVVNLEQCFKTGVLDQFVALQDPTNGHPCGECRLVCYFRPTVGLGTQPSPQQQQPQIIYSQPQPAYVVAPPPQPIIVQQQPQLPVFVVPGQPVPYGYAPQPQGYAPPPQGYAPPPGQFAFGAPPQAHGPQYAAPGYPGYR